MANRTLSRFGTVVEPDDLPDEASDEKLAPLSPAGLVDDPAEFYATLGQRLDGAELVAVDRPSPVSPATRLVDTCRRLG